MKLISSFKKELILAFRSFYFYVEILFALVLLAVLLFAIPEHSTAKQTEYIYIDMPQAAAEQVVATILEDDIDGRLEPASLTAAGESFAAQLAESEDQKLYIVDSERAAVTLADTQMNIGAVISIGAQDSLHYKYYLQGYESERLKNLITVIHSGDPETLKSAYDAQTVRALSSGYEPLNDRENAIPPLLAFNSSLMGMFIMAAYVFLDKKEGVINAFAVTASSVSRYLLSKIFVILLTSVASGLIVVAPVMGLRPNYALLLLLFIASGFFASVAGLLLASFFKDISRAFGLIFFILVIMLLPGISYFLPGWNPVLVGFIPSGPLMQGFRESIVAGGDAVYALLVSVGFLAVGVALFGLTNIRFKKSLSV